MWMLPPEAAAAERSSGLQLRPDGAALRVGLSVMYSDAGFDVSRCGRYLALCELDPAVRRARHAHLPAHAHPHPHPRTRIRARTRGERRTRMAQPLARAVAGGIPSPRLLARKADARLAPADRHAAKLPLCNLCTVLPSDAGGAHWIRALPGAWPVASPPPRTPTPLCPSRPHHECWVCR